MIKAERRCICRECEAEFVFSVFDGKNWSPPLDLEEYQGHHYREKHPQIIWSPGHEPYYFYFLSFDSRGQITSSYDHTYFDNVPCCDVSIGEPYVVEKPTTSPLNEFSRASRFGQIYPHSNS